MICVRQGFQIQKITWDCRIGVWSIHTYIYTYNMYKHKNDTRLQRTFSFFIKYFIYLSFREKGMEGGRGREALMWERNTDWGLNPQPRHVLWLGIELMTFHLAEWHPTNRNTPVGAREHFLSGAWKSVSSLLVTQWYCRPLVIMTHIKLNELLVMSEIITLGVLEIVINIAIKFLDSFKFCYQRL